MRTRLILSAALALLISSGPAAAHPNEFELRIRVNLGLAPGQAGPPALLSPRASSRNVETIGHANPGGFNGDVVAHKGYAYLGSWGTAIDEESYVEGTYCPSQGVRVYSLFNLASPTKVATFASGAADAKLAGSWTEKVIVRRVSTPWFSGDLAAVSFQDCKLGGFRGIGLYDVSDPTSPVELSVYENGVFGVHELWLQPRGNRAYVYEAALFEEVDQFFTTGVPGNPDFRIIDVSDPRNPEQVGSWGAWEELGIEPVDALGSFPFNFTHSIIGSEDGTKAYLSYWDLGTVILDVTDPAAPSYVGRTTFAPHEEGNAHSAWLAQGGRILIQNDEDFDPGFFTPPGTEMSWGYSRIFDISNPAAPVQLATFKLPTTTQFPPMIGDYTVHDPKVRGSSLFLSHYAQGVVVVDISRPAKPRQIAQFLPEPSADPFGLFFPGEEYSFVWGVFPEHNYVLASDVNSGLWVFRVR